MLRVKNLRFSYSSGFGLSVDEFSISKNSLNVIIGPNGSGKTTFAKIISGLISDYGGTIEIDGKNIKKLDIKQRGRLISYIHKRMVKNLSVSVRDFLRMGRYVHKDGLFLNPDKKDEEIIEETLQIVDLHSKGERILYELSDGELQRACIAKVLAQKTQYTVLDEPTSALDLSHIAEILNLLIKLKNKTTFIVILHDINEAVKIYDNLICMNGGRIECVWKSDEYFDLKKIEKLFKIKLSIFDYGTGKVVYF